MENSDIWAIETYTSTLDMWRSSLKKIMRESSGCVNPMESITGK